MLTFRNQEQFVWDKGPVSLDMVRDWADNGDDAIRIDMYRSYVTDVLGVSWAEKDKIIAAFRAAKKRHREDIRRCAGVDRRNGVRVFVFD
jgi:hypothetical protein